MRKIILSLSAALLASTPVWAINCQVETDCATLGYTSDGDEGGCLKCPFGNKWACETSSIEVGDILYSDMTTSSEVISGKTPIGVVFDSKKKLAIALEEAIRIYWSESIFDSPEITNYSSTTQVIEDWNGKENTKAVWEYCQAQGKTCSAFRYVSLYRTEGTSAGDWYLPAPGELNAIYSHNGALNTTLSKIGGVLFDRDNYWACSEYDTSNAWYQAFGNGRFYGGSKNDTLVSARPVIAFPVAVSSEPMPKPEIGPCKVGSILYSDKTCSVEPIDGKTPIGVVFDAEKRLAFSLSLGGYFYDDKWTEEDFDVPGLTNYDSKDTALTDFNGKENTKIVWEYCQANYKRCYAFSRVDSKSTEGTKSGDWYLPALGELYAIYENRDILNDTLIKLSQPVLYNNYFISSTEESRSYVWCVGFNFVDIPQSVVLSCSKDASYYEPYVLPVLAF